VSFVYSQLDAIFGIALFPPLSCLFVGDVSTSAIRRPTHARMIFSRLRDAQ
jgi:hypothetical protein